MTVWSYKNLDYSRAKAGDTIEDEYDISYIVEIRERNKRADQISPEYSITVGGYRRNFYYHDEYGSGFSFPVYSNGKPYDSKFVERIAELEKDPTYRDYGVEYDETSWNEAAVIRCQCGGEVALEMVMTNTCDKCHRDYNSSGQLLAPREQWGWDTGESVSDILSADWGINDPGPGHYGYDELGD